MFKICLPISHLFDENPFMLGQFNDIIDSYELKFVKDYSFLGLKENLFHASRGIIDHDFISFVNENKLFDYLRKYDVKLFSFDFGPACEYSKSIFPASRTLTESEIYKIVDDKLEYVRKHFSGVLAVENLNYYGTGLFEHICKPEFIRAFIEKFNLYFLLDLAHARISANNLGYDFHEYLCNLPLDRIIEIHISRPIVGPLECVDAHDYPLEEDFSILDRLKSKFKNNSVIYIVIEYYKDAEKLFIAYNELQRRLNV